MSKYKPNTSTTNMSYESITARYLKSQVVVGLSYVEQTNNIK